MTFKEIADDILDEMQEAFESINNYIIEIGVFSDKTSRKSSKLSAGITNAGLMYIHENGSPVRNIPARPVLNITLNYLEKELWPETLDRIENGCFTKNWSKDNVKTELQKMCKRLQNYARHVIYDNDGRLAPNAQSTQHRKGDNHPLFNTGQLARSIQCKLVEK